MRIFPITPSQLEPLLDLAADADDRLPRSVANPRRTTWTGFAKGDADRLPAN